MLLCLRLISFCCLYHFLTEFFTLHAEMENQSRTWFLLTASLLVLIASEAGFALAADTISLEQPLSGNQTIISEGGIFELGFFTPGQSRNYYIGIWYRKISKKTIVWVANRETPLPDTSSELKIAEDGHLVLVNDTKIPIWSSNATSTASNRTIAILRDNGNLVLTDGSNSSLVFWQSFDYPTDTWLPEQRVGLNKVTGFRQRIISWRNSEDPAPGLYSLQIEADGTNQFFYMWNDSYRYWNSGIWDGQKFPTVTEKPPSLKVLYINSTTYVSNEKENYYTYSVKNGIIMRFVMETTGLFGHWLWDTETNDWGIFLAYPPNQCDVYAVCGPSGVCNEDSSTLCTCMEGFRPESTEGWKLGGWSTGCVRESDLMCADNNSSVNGQKAVVFKKIPNMQLPVNPKSLTTEGVEKCKAACSDDCTCTAFSYNSSGCFVWNGDLLNLRRIAVTDSEQGDFYVRSLAEKDKGKKGVLTWVIAGCSVALLASLVIISMLICRWRGTLLVRTSIFSADSLVPFKYRDLRRATNDFADKLGAGSFGCVFKGALPESNVVAVKKWEELGQGEKQFRSEISTIGKIQHVNLVRLRGFCSEGTQRLLVYDFMPNGSLATQLFGQNSNVVSWKTRYQIALGIAKGLAYLHEGCRECILHCDIKPENILLDSAFCPKVADFGMAKLLGREFSRVLTTMRGTWGYLAPEWIQGMAITAKADVFSYGMVVLEIISGRRNSEQPEMSGIDYFPVWAASKIKEGDVLCLLDPRLDGNANIEELNRAIRVACWCIQDDETSRPSMGQVVQILQGFLEVSLPPIPRFLQTLFPNGDTVVSSYTEKRSHSMGGSG